MFEYQSPWSIPLLSYLPADTVQRIFRLDRVARIEAAVRRRNLLHRDVARLFAQTARAALEVRLVAMAAPRNRRGKATGCAEGNNFIEKSRKIEFIPAHERLKP
jgi:hypothetical protein